MKETDLMLLDWVLWKNRYVQIVRTCSVVYSFGHRDVWLAHCNDDNVVECHDMSKISPIPLTPEILEKNGFEMFKYDGWVHYYRIFGNSVIPFVLHSTIGGEMLSEEVDIFSTSTNTNRGIDVNYVHELQHALRLCGLNELADNFKL